MKAIGYQHINRHKLVETDASDSSINNMFSSTSDDIIDEPESRRQKKESYKTCRLKTFMDCNSLLLLHDDTRNFTHLKGTETKLVVLISYPQNSKTICQKIRVATNLGLFLEDILSSFGDSE